VSLLERAVAAVDVPVIGSLNGVTPGGWADYARAMQDAGAAAIELNIYYLPGDPHTSARDVEQRHIDVLERVKDAVTVPVAVKLSPHFSSTGEMALRLDEAGADGLVLFNRFLQPDIDPETLAVVAGVGLSHPAEARLPRTWIALLRGRVRASLAATTGVEGRPTWPSTSLPARTSSCPPRRCCETARSMRPCCSTVCRIGCCARDSQPSTRYAEAVGAVRHRRGRIRARGLRRRYARSQQQPLRSLVGR
jgi:hypothetical protein